MCALVEAALPAFDSLTVGLLANMTHVALHGSTSPSSRARVLEEYVPEYLDDGVGNIGVVVLTVHITALAGQVIAVANFVFLSTAMIFFHGICRWVGAVRVEAVTIFIDGNKILGLEALSRQVCKQKFLRPTHNW